jgi:hypothetical protein
VLRDGDYFEVQSVVVLKRCLHLFLRGGVQRVALYLEVELEDTLVVQAFRVDDSVTSWRILHWCLELLDRDNRNRSIAISSL